MRIFQPIKPARRPRIGIYSIGHAHYWEQFEGMHDRLTGYGKFIADRVGQWADVQYAGMVDNESRAREVAELFNQHNVDLIFCHSATHAMTASHIHIAQHCRRPIVVLNLQPTTAMNYEKTTTTGPPWHGTLPWQVGNGCVGRGNRAKRPCHAAERYANRRWQASHHRQPGRSDRSSNPQDRQHDDPCPFCLEPVTIYECVVRLGPNAPLGDEHWQQCRSFPESGHADGLALPIGEPVRLAGFIKTCCY